MSEREEQGAVERAATPQPQGAGAGQGARHPVAAYGSYEEAQRAVDFLSDRGFPVDQVAIVGRDLEYVEQVTGRLTTARAALMGALQGALLGIFLALILGLFFTVSGAYFALLLYGLIVGAIIGALLGAVTHAATGGRRDFSSVGAMRANRYELLVDQDAAEEASRLLGELSQAPADASAPAGGPGGQPG